MNKSTERENILGILFAFIAVIFWSGNFVAARGMENSLPPVMLSFSRWAIASIVLVAIYNRKISAHKSLIFSHKYLIFLSAIIGIACFNTCIYYAGHYLPASQLALLNCLAPMLIAFSAPVLVNENRGRYRYLGGTIALAGIILIFIASAGYTKFYGWLTGLGIMTLAVLCFGGYALTVKRLTATLDVGVNLTITVVIGTLVLTPFAIGDLSSSITTMKANYPILLYIGIGSSVLSFLCWNLAIKMAGAGTTAGIYYLIPVTTAVIAWVFIGEVPNRATIVATPFILTGAYVASLK